MTGERQDLEFVLEMIQDLIDEKQLDATNRHLKQLRATHLKIPKVSTQKNAKPPGPPWSNLSMKLIPYYVPTVIHTWKSSLWSKTQMSPIRSWFICNTNSKSCRSPPVLRRLTALPVIPTSHSIRLSGPKVTNSHPIQSLRSIAWSIIVFCTQRASVLVSLPAVATVEFIGVDRKDRFNWRLIKSNFLWETLLHRTT